MNLEEPVRAALAEGTKAEPDEAGAYERFLGRRRHRPGPAAAATAVTPTSEPPQGPVETTRPAPPPVPVSAAGVVRRERQGSS